jgi:hypothetical protein
VIEDKQSVTCDVVGCNQPGAGRYLDVRAEAAVEFQVCADHFARIEAGEAPRVVVARSDAAELQGELVLVMDAI